MNELQTVDQRAVILELAKADPSLADLTAEQFEAIRRLYTIENLKDQMKRAVMAERVNMADEAARFLADQKSDHTRRAYSSALTAFARWLEHKGLNLAALSPALADDYIRDLKAEGQDEDTARLKIAALSSFFTFLERRFSEIRNPFRGTKIRPRSTWATATIPTVKELKAIQAKADPLTRAALSIIIETGLRIGALPELRIKADGSFYTLTKGSRFEGFEPLSVKTMEAIKAAGLNLARPFDPETLQGRGGKKDPASRMAASLTERINRHCQSLKEAGAIAARYSPHDFRHAFAEANASKGLVWLRDRLGHASIAVTEHYLKNTLGRNTSGV